ncbi:hypothetical protein ACJRO7_027558 [Eucalyptus globulus]|uniref:Uncharacterized protein n=1 Tax=Eucalyptus globulus TaxID=34317 RepID=A0ABD3JSV8_EUCGL
MSKTLLAANHRMVSINHNYLKVSRRRGKKAQNHTLFKQPWKLLASLNVKARAGQRGKSHRLHGKPVNHSYLEALRRYARAIDEGLGLRMESELMMMSGQSGHLQVDGVDASERTESELKSTVAGKMELELTVR